MPFHDRNSGIPLIGDVRLGTHFCQFYHDVDDLLDIIVPFLAAGLRDKDYCVWVVPEGLTPDEALGRLCVLDPAFADETLQKRLSVISLSRFTGSAEDAGSAVVSLLDESVTCGCNGLRLVCDGYGGSGGMQPETIQQAAQVIGRLNVIALCTYPREEFDASGLMDIVKNHAFALVRNAGEWEVIESSEAHPVREALRLSEENLESLFSNMSEGFAYHRIVLDGGGKPCDYVFLDANAAFEDLTGLKQADIIGRPVTQVIPGIEKDPTDWIGRYGHVALTGEPDRFESCSEGLGKWYEVSAFSAHHGFFGVTFEDITQRKRVEQEIRHRNSVLKGLNEVFQEALKSETGEQLADRCLKVAEEMTASAFGFIGEMGADGRLHDIAIGELGWEVCSMYDKSGHRRPPGDFELRGIYGRVLLDGRSFYTNHPPAHHDSIGTPAGHPPLTSFLGVPLKRGGQVVGMIALANRAGGYRDEDVQSIEALAPAFAESLSRVRAEQELQQALISLEQSNTDLQQFAYVASHDLREPLRVITSYIQLLARDYGEVFDRKGRQSMDYITSGARRMSAMIDDLLVFSHAGVNVTLAEVDSGATVMTALNNLRLMIGENQAKVTCGDLPVVAADSSQLVQLWQNLIGNAIKFRREEKPLIRISAVETGDDWRFSVADNGIGIDERFADKVFDIFQRLHSREEYPGTGIGLAICRRIVERHGGRIWMEPRPGEGTTFHFTIPIKEVEHVA